jgi:hypothetical protein
MAARPYRNMRVDELDRLFAEAPQNAARLHAILTELGLRSTSRALDLKRRLQTHLANGPLSQSSEQATVVPKEQPRPARTPPRRDDEAGAAGEMDAQEAEPNRQQFRAERPMDATSMSQQPATAPGSPKPELSPAQHGVSQLIDYVRVLIELADKPVWSLASYNNVALHEDYLRNRIGIRHDLTDADGPVYLKIDRLRRTDPPEPPSEVANWLTVGRDPLKEPVVQSLRTTVMAAQEAERLIAEGTIDRADVTNTLKPKPGENLRDVVLRLERFPETKTKIEHYIARTWIDWAQAERPRCETIDIYDRLFSVQQALKLEGADRPLEIVWGMGVARWKMPPNELDHPLVEQLVELELDELDPDRETAGAAS